MPRLRSTSYSASPKSSPTGPTTRTSVKKLAASEKCTAEPPSMRSRSPNGVRTASKAIDPTTTRLIGGDSTRRCGAVTALALAFASSVSWGVADFLGGLKSRQLPVLNVLLASQGTGLVLVGDLHADPLGAAARRRLRAVGGALRRGRRDRAGGVLPRARGRQHGRGRADLGHGRGRAGGRRASRRATGPRRSSTPGSCWRSSASCSPRARRCPAATARGAGFAVLSALGFGFFFVGMDNASDADIGWAMLGNRITSFSLLLAAFAVLRPPLAARRAGRAGARDGRHARHHRERPVRDRRPRRAW